MKWLGRKAVAPRSVPDGHRVYAVGDVHGRLDLLEDLLSAIEADIDAAPRPRVTMVFLGDLIDRGSDSRGVIERLRTYRRPVVQPVFLLGNHEEVLLRLLRGERGILESWLKFGGSKCLESYGVDAAAINPSDEREALRIVRTAIPDDHRTFLQSFADSLRIGDYLFVHAGIRPGIEIDQQVQRDLRWIRRDFLDDESDHGVVVVHGHTISEEVQVRPNRIGIDTGAYHSGRLTCLVIEGERHRIIHTGVDSTSKTVD